VPDRAAERWVLALGGNALADPRDPADLARQGERAAALALPVVDALASGVRLAIVHGNGPQVGARLIQGEAARSQVPAAPLHVYVAETQGQIGHELALALTNEARRRAADVPVVCLITHVLVDARAPEFDRPDKPVGPVYAAEEAGRLERERGWAMMDVPGGRRRVVASPRPLEVVEQRVVERLLDEGVCVIAAGGGGVPLAARDGALAGVDAVVDKDYAAERLATAAGAARLIVLTDVPGAAISFGSAAPRYLESMTVAQARAHLARGEFAPGSMRPKVEACAAFVEAGGREAFIASMPDAAAALAGRAGTRVVRG
jgi:carbamate kinase